MTKFSSLFEFGHIRFEKILDMGQSSVEVGFFSFLAIKFITCP